MVKVLSKQELKRKLDLKKEYLKKKFKIKKEIDICMICCGNNDIIHGPCNKHTICKGCLVRLVKEKTLINRNHPLIRCLGNEDNCLSNMGMNIYFSHSDIKKLLTNEEYQEYIEHSEQYRFPGFEIVKCKLFNYNRKKRCNQESLVMIEEIEETKRGNLLIHCVQSGDCNRVWCYHCEREVQTNSCSYCLISLENKNIESYNKFFYNPKKTINNGKLHFKNKELEPELVISQLEEKINSDKLSIRCMNCLVMMEKADQCNGLEHETCSYIERCYSCGRSGTKNNPRLKDHWQDQGVSGCPRWDDSGYWKKNIKYKCKENVCHSLEKGDCKIKSHQEGIRQMVNERKKAHIYHALKSLYPELRKKIILKLKIPKEYIPSNEAFDILDSNDSYNVFSCYSEKLLLKKYKSCKY